MDKIKLDTETKVCKAFNSAKKSCLVWLSGNPTGVFTFELVANDGGIRGRPVETIKTKQTEK